jgi:hypothetical protein
MGEKEEGDARGALINLSAPLARKAVLALREKSITTCIRGIGL